MIEFFHLHGLTLIYPSLPFQTSFSTNHYEEGVHTIAHHDLMDEAPVDGKNSDGQNQDTGT
jgi:hypothetical protein